MTEAWEHWRKQQEADVLARWYKSTPTDQELASVAAIERAWSRSRSPPLPHSSNQAKWHCEVCKKPAEANDPASEAYTGNVCGRCARGDGWFSASTCWDC